MTVYTHNIDVIQKRVCKNTKWAAEIFLMQCVLCRLGHVIRGGRFDRCHILHNENIKIC